MARFPNTVSQHPSPLPQSEVQRGGVPVLEQYGFFAKLPQRDHVYFRRAYVVAFPIPVQQAAGQPPFPNRVPLLSLRVPSRIAITFQVIDFTAYEQTGLDPEDVSPIDPKRAHTFLAWSFQIGGISKLDLLSNISGGTPGSLAPQVPVGAGAATSSVESFGGSTRDKYEQFALYAWPGQTLKADAIILRSPLFEVRRLSVEVSGFILSDDKLDRLLRQTVGT